MQKIIDFFFLFDMCQSYLEDTQSNAIYLHAYIRRVVPRYITSSNRFFGCYLNDLVGNARF